MFRIFNSKNTKRLLKENQEEVQNYNAKILPGISFSGGIVALVSFICSFFREDMRMARLGYLAIILLCFFLLVFSKKDFLKKHSLFFMYVELYTFYFCALYLSVHAVRERPAASMLLALAIFPTVFIDHPSKLFLNSLLMYFIHTGLACVFKGAELCKVDAINGIVAVVMGAFVGYISVDMKLKALDFERLLTLEKETDLLTSLKNRRKLFEVMTQVEKGEKARPSGVVMFDLDYFKNYNDSYGHVAGDRCLKKLGELILHLPEDPDVCFYRYGGEELIALLWNKTEEETRQLCENVRSKVEQMPTEYGKITVSVGYVCCDDFTINDYETWVNRADKALYSAKASGRNCVKRYEQIF